MIELDMNFMFYGRERDEQGAVQNYLYQTKEMEVKKKFKIHQQTRYVDKLPAMKILVSVGTDYRFKETGASEDKLTCIKMWDFESLISDTYSEFKRYEYTGGSVWDR